VAARDGEGLLGVVVGDWWAEQVVIVVAAVTAALGEGV